MSSEYRSCWHDLVHQLTETGEFIFRRIQLPHTPYTIAAYTVLSACEIASNMARFDGIKYGRIKIVFVHSVSTALQSFRIPDKEYR